LSWFVVSIDALKAFAALVHADSDLQAHVKGATSANEVVALAASHGHQFTKATLLREHAKAVHSADDHTLEGINSWGDALIHAFAPPERL
jgi:predicted ribosomally synthesized peptide with nif11-like leader